MNIYGDDSWDVLQDFYLKCYNNKDKNIIKDGELNKGYCFFILRNLCYDFHKAQKPHEPFEPISTPIEEQIFQHDLTEEIEKYIDSLYWYDCLIFNLHVKEKMSFRQIEREVKISSRSAFQTVKDVKLKIISKFGDKYKEKWHKKENQEVKG